MIAFRTLVQYATGFVATGAEALHRSVGGSVNDVPVEVAVAQNTVDLTHSLCNDLEKWVTNNMSEDGRVGNLDLIRVLDQCRDYVDEAFPDLAAKRKEGGS